MVVAGLLVARRAGDEAVMFLRLTEGDEAWYMDWSKIRDAPRSFGLPYHEFFEYVRYWYGQLGVEDLARSEYYLQALGNPMAEPDRG